MNVTLDATIPIKWKKNTFRDHLNQRTDTEDGIIDHGEVSEEHLPHDFQESDVQTRAQLLNRCGISRIRIGKTRKLVEIGEHEGKVVS